jgi:NAD(P)-dependent dehydrogenase (short-subunit alcohol dehydrogenase family)
MVQTSGGAWTAANIPALTGRTAVVTGASSGIGYEIAVQLAAHGAHVVLASRDRTRTADAVARLRSAALGGSAEAGVLDLADLAAVRRFAESFRERHDGLDMLVNNAGIVGGPRRETADGFEAHFGTNHLGHFALAGLLLPALLARPGSRVVTLSSGLAAQVRLDFEDLQSRRGYRMTTAYGRSKLANLVFAVELDRRARAAGRGVASLAAHPGVARTNLLVGRQADWGRGRRGAEIAVRFVQLMFAQSAATGALPALYQATAPNAESSEYLGPKGHMRGYPTPGEFPPAALDRDSAERLWSISERLTSVSYDALRTAV